MVTTTTSLVIGCFVESLISGTVEAWICHARRSDHSNPVSQVRNEGVRRLGGFSGLVDITVQKQAFRMPTAHAARRFLEALRRTRCGAIQPPPRPAKSKPAHFIDA